MKTKEIAKRLAELCTKGDFETAQKELFAADATSTEPYETPAFEKEVKGLNNILAKGQKFVSMVESMNSLSVSEPICSENAIAMTLAMEVTMKEKGQMKMTELCVYELKDSKIISERFYM